MDKTIFACLALAGMLVGFRPHQFFSVSPQQVSPEATSKDSCEPEISGFFEGTATSRQDGALKVSLNLSCRGVNYSGDFMTPVGKFQVFSASVREKTLLLVFGADQDRGTMEAEIDGTRLRGHFTFGDDSGPVELTRTGETRSLGYDKPTLKLTAEQWREDLRYFATELPKVHANSFFHLSREAFESAVATADNELQHADGDEAYVAIDRIANAVGDGHTFVVWPDDLAHAPINIRFFDGEYRIVATAPGNERLLGTRIVKVGDVPIEQVIDRLRQLTPAAETKTLGDIRIEDFLAIGMLLHGIGIIPNRENITYTVADDKGSEFTAVLHGMSMDDAMMAPTVKAFRQPGPLYLQNGDRGLWCNFLSQTQLLYCSFRTYENLAENAAQLFSELERRHPKKLAIDLRFNLGGDYTLGQKYLIQPLARLPEINKKGHLFVLISAYTFSAGMSNAAQFKSATNCILVGQPIGERPNSYQEAREIRLPNSHLIVRVSTQYYEFLKGSQENVLRPDKEIPRTWKDYNAGRDAPLEWIENY